MFRNRSDSAVREVYAVPVERPELRPERQLPALAGGFELCIVLDVERDCVPEEERWESVRFADRMEEDSEAALWLPAVPVRKDISLEAGTFARSFKPQVSSSRSSCAAVFP